MAESVVDRIITFEMPREFEEAYIYPIGDMHLGDPACDLQKLYRYLGVIKERPNAYIMLNGDLGNIAIRSSVSDVHTESFSVSEQRKRLVKIFEPYRERIIAMTSGNHEDRISRECGDLFTETLAIMLGIEERYREEECYVRVRLGRYTDGEHSGTQQVTYDIYMTHGWSGGRRPGAAVNALEDMEHIVDADIYIGSHSHREAGFPLDVHRFGTRTVTAHKHLFVSTGGYLRRKGYAVRKGFRPVHPGSPRIRLDGRRRDAHVSI